MQCQFIECSRSLRRAVSQACALVRKATACVTYSLSFKTDKRNKRACERAENRWSPLPMDTRNPKGVISCVAGLLDRNVTPDLIRMGRLKINYESNYRPPFESFVKKPRSRASSPGEPATLARYASSYTQLDKWGEET
ncbi:hypothetical protein EVAR_58116_1 [Eumeta japonica]|uniref:Uncharacterized protein n=1 Tax=Eumeta variegata TaxID=151549 RepID=A0A4C1YNA9_EUMVA|nr:hypothetical protein EVAR_58116_1 [Eumeta japonica]